MKKNLLLLLCLFCLVNVCHAKAKDTFTVFQLNLWHGCTKVPNGDQGIIDVLDQMDADVVFLCEIRDGKQFIPHVIEELEKRGKHYYGETFDLAIGVLSKFKPDSWTKCCIVPGDEGRAMVKMVATIEGQPVSFYSCHLDYRHYQCYMPRGYNGTTWKKMDKPITDEEEVLKANRQSFRDETIRAFIQEVQSDIQQGRPIIMGGDFNEPSHLDWQADTKDLWDHNGAVIHWDCSMMLSKAGFKDTYREKYPNTVRYPGFTFPAGNKLAEEAKLEKLAWAPEADERDRIDFIYYYPLESMLSMKNGKLVGPSETVVRGKITENDSKDKILTPSCIWPSDHKGNLATFKIRKKR